MGLSCGEFENVHGNKHNKLEQDVLNVSKCTVSSSSLVGMDYLTVIDACFACTCADVSKVRFKLGEVSAKRPVLLQTAAEVVWIPGSRMQKGLVDKKK